jgi:hypothetical protein
MKNSNSGRYGARIAASLLLAMLAWNTVGAEKPPLVGVIRGSDGKPLPDARVFVYTAKPRVGAGITCPSCYPDCGKGARTSVDGEFEIPSVDPELTYRLIVLAKGHRPMFITNADPTGAAVKAKLREAKFGEVPLENQTYGKIINESGKPVSGATIEVSGVKKGTSTRYGGTSSTIDSMAVTDDNGEFVINGSEPFDSVTVTIDGPRVAKRRVWLDGGKSHFIRMDAGVTVTGRLLNDGKPVPNVVVAMATQERESSVFMRGFEVATDRDGKFNLEAVPADNRYFLYTKMADMRPLSLALPLQSVKSGTFGSKVELGDLVLKPAHRLRGRIVLEDGSEPLPPKTRIHLSREDAWDYGDVTVAEDGTFEFKAVPAESIGLSVRVPGCRVSGKNPNKDWLNEGRLVGRLERSIDDFIIHLEFGERFERNDGPPDGERQPKEKLLRSATITSPAAK